eukprot:349763-Chlamydomonas_euryale.AAC.11
MPACRQGAHTRCTRPIAPAVTALPPLCIAPAVTALAPLPRGMLKGRALPRPIPVPKWCVADGRE